MQHPALTVSPSAPVTTAGVTPYLIWPLLLGLNATLIWALFQLGLGSALVYMLGFFSSLLSMGIAERLWPYRRDWQPDSREWLVNGLYFLQNGLVSAGGKLLAGLLVLQFAHEGNALPLLIGAPLAIVIANLPAYWWHRLGHGSAFVWRFHGIHHAPEKVFMFNNNTVHFVDLFVGTLVSTLPLLLLGFSAEVIALALFFANFQGFFAHLNADARLGWLGYVVMGPEHHRFHHSVKLNEALNYSSELALWDQLFGTFLYRPGEAPQRVGVADGQDLPAATDLKRSILHPFQAR